jgi:polyhydroxyalkanoate synthesis regulator phasin
MLTRQSMPKHDTPVDRVARLTHEAVSDIRDQMVTKADLKAELREMEDRLGTHFKEVKADLKQVIADEAANTVEIARLKERLGRLEKRVGLTK